MSIRVGHIFLSVGLAALLAGLLSFLLPEKSYACSCVRPGSPTEELEKSAAVFSGTVKSTTPSSSEHLTLTAEVEVNAVWKGPLYQTMYVSASNPRQGPVCGMHFVEGAQYIFYAVYEIQGSDYSPDWWVNRCTLTSPIAGADYILDELGEGQAPIVAPPTSPQMPSAPTSDSTSESDKDPPPTTAAITSAPTPPSPEHGGGGGCGLTSHKADLSIVGLMLGIVWLSLGRRRPPQEPW